MREKTEELILLIASSKQIGPIYVLQALMHKKIESEKVIRVAVGKLSLIFKILQTSAKELLDPIIV